MTSREDHIAVGALILMTAVGFAWRWTEAVGVIFPSVDGTAYMTVARSLVRDGTLQFSTFPPGWPLLISIPLAALGADDAWNVLRAAQVANVVLGSAAVVLVFVLLRSAIGNVGAWAGAAIMAFLPAAVIASTKDLSEMSYVVVFVGAWLAWRSERWWWAGGLFGFAYLIRPEAIGIVVLLVAWRAWRERHVAWKALVAAAPIVVPYLIWIRVETFAWSLSSKGGFLERALEQGDVAGRWFANLATLLDFLPGMIGFPLLALAVWGVARRRGIELLAFVPLLLLPFFDFRMEARYWLPILPFLLWFAGVGARDLIERVEAGRVRAMAMVGLTVVTLGGVAVAARDDAGDIGANYEAFHGMRDAGRWLAANSDADAEVMGYKPYVAFWAGRPYHKLPERDSAMEIVDYARERSIEYLVVNLALVRSLTPELEPLMSVEEPEPALARKVELVHLARKEGDARQTTAIYRIVPVGGRRS